tara:strand:- start:12435 stop:13286 length:852 start_codon:yes stop_codon:yes gene_type:complete
MDKVRYFLKKYPNREWSGPAWYSQKFNETGFPTEVKLEYFHVLNLGSASETDWDGADLAKRFTKLRKLYPKIGTKWVQGNVHSHHTMGAFFSGTDKEQLDEGVNEEGFYYSLVVSTKPGKEIAFGFSYMDQFKNIHREYVNKFDVSEYVKKCPDWEEEVKFIEKESKKASVITIGKSRTKSYIHGGQGTLFYETHDPTVGLLHGEHEEDSYEEYLDFASYNGWSRMNILNEETFEAVKEIEEKYNNTNMNERKFKKLLKKAGSTPERMATHYEYSIFAQPRSN